LHGEILTQVSVKVQEKTQLKQGYKTGVDQSENIKAGTLDLGFLVG